MLTIITWLWGDKYSLADVEKLFAGVGRNLKQPHDLICVCDRPRRRESAGVDYWTMQIKDRDLLQHKGCFARLRMFDPEWATNFAGVFEDDRLVSIDLDVVITGPLDPLFDRPEPFVILQGANAANPCPYNGSLMMLRAGAHPEVWSDFSLEAAAKAPFYEYPDDQGWLAHKVPGAAGWQAGRESGVYAFKKPGWPVEIPGVRHADDLPADARMVVFPGGRSPAQFAHLPWIQECWR